MRPRSVSLLLALGMVSTACGGDGGSGPSPISLTGDVLDYFSGTALPAATLALEASGLTTTSAADGHYSLSDVPRNTSVTIVGQLTNYRSTRSRRITLGTSNVVSDLQLVATSDANRQYTQVSLTQTAGSAALYIELVDANGDPRSGIGLSDIALTTTGGAAAGTGPYAFGTGGDLDPALTVTTVFGNRSRVAFLNVPVGVHTLTVTLSGPMVLTVAVVASADGVTLAAL